MSGLKGLTTLVMALALVAAPATALPTSPVPTAKPTTALGTGTLPKPTTAPKATTTPKAPTTTTTTTTATTTVPQASGDAVSLEAAAFEAVEREEWCLAMHLFEAADGAEPAAPLVVNAAQAAEYAKDWASALRLHQRLATEGDKTQMRDGKARVRALKAQVQKTGAGTPCPPMPPPPPPVVEAPPEPAVEAPPRAAPPSSPPMGTIGAVTAGSGTLIAVAGAVMVGFGSLPWSNHAAASAAITAAEADKADASALQQAQATARAEWEGWGSALVVVGSAAAALGLTAMVAGTAFVLGRTPGGPDGENSE